MSKARQLAQRTNQSGRKNLIINGAMDVHQRGGTISITNGTGYTLDRFKIGRGSSYNFDVDVSQSSDAPADFVNSLKIDVQATATPSGSENATLEYSIEGQDLTHLNYGSSSGKYVVLSFWVKSNKTGTYGCQFKLDSNSRNFTNSYTINSSNTWEKKTITINPDTAGAAFADNNLVGARIIWHLSTGPDDIISGNRDWTADASFRSVTGQVNLLDSTSNEFYITGVQLEVGSAASEFEHRSFGEELALCQRYYYMAADGSIDTDEAGLGLCYAHSDGEYRSAIQFPVQMRDIPSLDSPTVTDGYRFVTGASSTSTSQVVDSITIAYPNWNNKRRCLITSGTGQPDLNAGGKSGYFQIYNSTTAYVAFDAEL